MPTSMTKETDEAGLLARIPLLPGFYPHPSSSLFPGSDFVTLHHGVGCEF